MMLLYTLSTVLTTILSIASTVTADCINDKKDCKCIAPANIDVDFFTEPDCGGSRVTTQRLNYSLGQREDGKSYRLSRPLRDEEQFDLSKQGTWHGAGIGDYVWACATYIGSAPKNAGGLDCYNVPNGDQANCYRVVNRNMCTDERGHA